MVKSATSSLISPQIVVPSNPIRGKGALVSLGERQSPGPYLFSPSLQLGQVQAIRRLFSPGCRSPKRACSICNWIWVGLRPLMVRLLPETFCTVSCCWPAGQGTIQMKCNAFPSLLISIHILPFILRKLQARSGRRNTCIESHFVHSSLKLFSATF